MKVSMKVNGAERSGDVEPRVLLVDFLRTNLAQTGTHIGCDTSSCGACTVLLDGEPVKSCTMLAVQADGREVTTVEGLAEDERLHPVQQAFMDLGGFQCGICTPGQIVAATALLHAHPRPTTDQVKTWMMGNLCRCTGYYKIVESILAAAEAGPAPVAREAVGVL